MDNNLLWFNQARYGMFIHWGAYSVAARGEWVLNRENIPYAEYIEKYVNNFKAEKFDPHEWVRIARDAGMKYMVLTTRHHDGFALWDTKTSDFNSVKMGPKKDLVRMFADAVREGGLKLGFYFSAADWHHPDYPDAYARDWPTGWKDESSRKRFIEYYYAQLEELMGNYGKVDLLWYDGCIPEPMEGEKINRRIKELQPHILINNRNGEPYDFKCCEQAIVPAAPGLAWEACMTLNDTWGYHSGDKHYKTPFEVLKLLLETSSKGGNLLLNVGPRADGTIPEESVAILKKVGDWLGKNGEAVYGSSRSAYSFNSSAILTTKGNRIYVNLLYGLEENEICLPDIKNKVLSVFMLESGKIMDFSQQNDRLFIKGIPFPLENELATTIVVEVEGKPETLRELKTFWIPG